jgi:hypothetical protein
VPCPTGGGVRAFSLEAVGLLVEELGTPELTVGLGSGVRIRGSDGLVVELSGCCGPLFSFLGTATHQGPFFAV